MFPLTWNIAGQSVKRHRDTRTRRGKEESCAVRYRDEGEGAIGGGVGGKKLIGRERRQKQIEGSTSSHLSAKLSNIISDVCFVSVVVFLQHSAQRNSVFCCHQMRHVTQ